MRLTKKNRGLLITFEGADGTGKSTQIELLAKDLIKSGYPVFVTREPGGTSFGEKVRNIVKTEKVTPLAELLLFEASRAELVETVIRPRLERGEIVLCDRYEESSLAYQGIVRELGVALVRNLNATATRKLKADFIVLLDPSRNLKTKGRLIARARSERNTDRFDEEGSAFHSQVQQAYRKLAQSDRRMHLYPSDLNRKLIHELILRDIKKFLGIKCLKNS